MEMKNRGDKVTTAVGHSNIALVKYWGKRDNDLNLPNNSSISITLDDEVKTTTSVVFSDMLRGDKFFINGNLQKEDTSNEKNMFMRKVLNDMRRMAGTESKALIVSENSFPESSGMASSASGAATLVFALSNALGLGYDNRQLSIISRKISGSACRSVYGGIVKWQRGSRKDGSDSYAMQIAKPSDWPDLVDVIAIVDPSKKKVSSSRGHALTVATSPLYKVRAGFAEKNVEEIELAVDRKDFGALATTIMRDSNNMHATMLDTWPPIMYLNDISRDIIYAVHEMNEQNGKVLAAYTFDAGPNAHIITMEKNRHSVLEKLGEISGIKRIVTARIGEGPRIVSDNLIDIERLAPLLR